MCGGLFTLFETQFGVKTRILHLKTKNAPEKETVYLQKRREMYIFVAVRLFKPSSVKKYS
jgi:hypothetical protein